MTPAHIFLAKRTLVIYFQILRLHFESLIVTPIIRESPSTPVSNMSTSNVTNEDSYMLGRDYYA